MQEHDVMMFMCKQHLLDMMSIVEQIIDIMST